MTVDMNDRDALLDTIRDGMAEVVPFARHAGVVLEEVADGRGRASLPDAEANRNHIGSVHAGALFTLAETASGAAMVGVFAERLGTVRPLVDVAEIRYHRVARGRLTAVAAVDGSADDLRAELLTQGRVGFLVRVEVLDGSGRAVATMTAGWVVTST